jgi:endonuclease YncB( thermonuclease family)
VLVGRGDGRPQTTRTGRVADLGRRLFSAWTDDGRFIEGELVASGAAKAIRVWPNVTNHPYLSGLEQRAASERKGRWGGC